MQNKLLFLLGVLLLIGVGCVSAETEKGTFILESTLTWYLCSAQNTTYIYYNAATTATGTPINNFGTINSGANYTVSSITEGFVTLLTTRSGVRDFLNPAVPNIVYNASLSCSDATVKTCEKASTVTKESWCLIVYNPTTERLLINAVLSTDMTNNVTSTTPSTTPTPSPVQKSAGQRSSGVETTVVSAIVGLMVAGILVAWV
ncbi:6210_t:CDS:2 [Paraglomus brasilianum]|uniref:6210_t:CDS:1 n=1 Tax=Paraglomus brasilianum TaxID=144538 RepID=A0A9N8WLJ5_9GLOM|nr:6210_t:CDS:2 [Paraglomus brasilianum]